MGCDIAVTVTTVVTSVVCFIYKSANRVSNEIDEVVITNGNLANEERRKTVNSEYTSVKNRFGINLARLAEVFPVVLLGLISVIWPCVLSSVYFMTFLIISTWWSIYLPVKRRTFNLFKLTLLFYCAFHMIVLYLYQLQVFQQTLLPQSLVAK